MVSANFYVYVFLRTDRPGRYIYKDLVFGYEPFYVGKGINNRMEHSLKYINNMSNKNKIKRYIIEKLNKNNILIKSLKIKENLSENMAYEYEMSVISDIGMSINNNGPLCNLSEGGECFNYSPVLQYGLDGLFIKEYMSVGEAIAQTGIKNVSPCCRGIRKTAGRYIWKYKIEDSYPLSIDVSFLDKMIHMGNHERGVLQYDKLGNYIDEFKSIKEASEATGCSRPRIVDVCKGNRKHTKGYKWVYKKKSLV